MIRHNSLVNSTFKTVIHFFPQSTLRRKPTPQRIAKQINCSIILHFSNLKLVNRIGIKKFCKTLTAERNNNRISSKVFSILGYLIFLSKLPTRNLSAFHSEYQKTVGSASHILCNCFFLVPVDSSNDYFTYLFLRLSNNSYNLWGYIKVFCVVWLF